jgi:hypothetical protein
VIAVTAVPRVLYHTMPKARTASAAAPAVPSAGKQRVSSRATSTSQTQQLTLVSYTRCQVLWDT